MAKSANTISKSPRLSKKRIVKTVEEIEFFWGALDESRANILANKQIEWISENEDATSFSRFFIEFGIIPRRYFEAVEVFPKLKSAQEFTKEIFAYRKQKIAEEKDPKFHSNSMHLYSYEFEQDKILEHKRKLELKAATTEKEKLSSEEEIKRFQSVVSAIAGVPVYGRNKNESEPKPD